MEDKYGINVTYYNKSIMLIFLLLFPLHNKLMSIFICYYFHMRLVYHWFSHMPYFLVYCVFKLLLLCAKMYFFHYYKDPNPRIQTVSDIHINIIQNIGKSYPYVLYKISYWVEIQRPFCFTYGRGLWTPDKSCT